MDPHSPSLCIQRTFFVAAEASCWNQRHEPPAVERSRIGRRLQMPTRAPITQRKITRTHPESEFSVQGATKEKESTEAPSSLSSSTGSGSCSILTVTLSIAEPLVFAGQCCSFHGQAVVRHSPSSSSRPPQSSHSIIIPTSPQKHSDLLPFHHEKTMPIFVVAVSSSTTTTQHDY